MATIANSKTPMTHTRLCKALDITEPDRIDALLFRLKAMLRDNQLHRHRGGGYALVDELEQQTGVVIGHRDGYGFVNLDNSDDKDLFLTQREMKKVMHGDRVAVQVFRNTGGGKAEAKVIKVLEHGLDEIVGRVFMEHGEVYVMPDDSRIAKDVLIDDWGKLDIAMGQMVVVRIARQANAHTPVTGRITQILSTEKNLYSAVEAVIRHHHLPDKFTRAVVDEAKAYGDGIPNTWSDKRVDLRDMPFVTIDGEDARDFDDAVYCESKKSGGWRLWVAIADVSYYVRPNSALDQEAVKRGTSVYFPQRVVPMLPEQLSNGLCSLNPDVDRFAMVCEMTISQKGRLSGFTFYQSVIRSKARLTYTKVGKMLDGDDELIEHYQSVWPHVRQLHHLYLALRSAREMRGALEFESQEPKFEFGADGRVREIVPVVRNDAHKLIEECMICANVAAARFLRQAGQPGLLRMHEPPKQQKVDELVGNLARLGIRVPLSDKVSPHFYAKIANLIKDRPDSDVLFTLLLRSMNQAVYAPGKGGHFGLALTEYAHFTSPIRRYPDLSIHRAIKQVIGVDGDEGAWHYEFEQLQQLGEQCSMTERNAEDASRRVEAWVKCDFMHDKVGEVFPGVVTSITGFGMFVRIGDYSIEGMLHISQLGDDYFVYDNTRQMLVGERTGRRWSLGDEMEIVVAQVDMDDYKIELLLADSVGRPSKKRRSSRKPASAKRAESRSSDNRTKPSVREQLKHGLPKKEKTKLKAKAKKKKSSTIQKKKATRRKDRQALKRK